MFVRIKKSGKYQYLQVVENHRTWGGVVQKVIGNMGRLDKYTEHDNLQHVIESLNKINVKTTLAKLYVESHKKRTHRKP